MKDIILKLFHKFRQLILYAIIGGISAGLDFVVFTLLCKAGMIVIAANIISIHCGIFCSFVLNRYFNFKVKDRALIRFLSFYVVGLIGLVFSTFLLWLMVENWLWNEIYAKLLTIPLVALLQFFLNKYVTFKKNKRKKVEK